MLHCENIYCRHYYEDSCMHEMCDGMISIDRTGRCETFQNGVFKEYLKIGMHVEVKGKYDFRSSIVEILELPDDSLNFSHVTISRPKIVSNHKYSDIIRIVESEL